jgi:hypothetical protein
MILSLNEPPSINCPIVELLLANASKGIVIYPNAFHPLAGFLIHKRAWPVLLSVQNVSTVNTIYKFNFLVIGFTRLRLIAIYGLLNEVSLPKVNLL